MSIQKILHYPAERSFNPQRRLRLLSLAKIIPEGHGCTHTINLFLEFALNIDYVDKKKYARDNPRQVQTIIDGYKEDLARGKLTIPEDAEPLEKFLIKAITRGKNWNQIIE